MSRIGTRAGWNGRLMNIETLSLTFTAGVVLGTLLPGSIRLSACAVAMSVLPVLIFRMMLRLRGGCPADGCSGAVLFLATGVFAAVSAGTVSLGAAGEGPLAGAAHSAAGAIRRVIDTLPFSDEKPGALLKALLTGDRSGLSADTVEAFRRSGASHILALSGLHLGILYLLLSRLTSPFGNSPKARAFRSLLAIGLSGFYTVAVGAGASIVRAFLFILIREVSGLLGRRRDALRTLCLALLVQLAVSPEVIRSTGFQLSYLAMAGIFLIHPHLAAFYPSSKGPDPVRKLWEALSLSLSCQLTTAPLVWLRFGTFPRYFLITNLLALPLTTVTIAAGVGCTCFQALGICPLWLVEATAFLLETLEGTLQVIASL